MSTYFGEKFHTFYRNLCGRMNDTNEQNFDEISLDSDPKCRICLSANDASHTLITPCNCKGKICVDR